jgi:hypothetical protein
VWARIVPRAPTNVEGPSPTRAIKPPAARCGKGAEAARRPEREPPNCWLYSGEIDKGIDDRTGTLVRHGLGIPPLALPQQG